LDDTLLVVTSDHGELFGEPVHFRDTTLYGHQIGVEEELLHVPLLVDHPDREPGHIETPTSLVNLYGTLLGAVDVDHGGRSLRHGGPTLGE